MSERTVPGFSVPNFSVPNFSVPGFSVPTASMPSFSMPEFTLRRRPLARPGDPSAELSWKSPVRSTYGPVTVLARRSRRVLAHHPGVSILQGDRKFGYPLLAATAYRELGICRHVLNQMVVAGTHMVPFGSGISILETFRPEVPTQSPAAPEQLTQAMRPPARPPMMPSSSSSEAPLSWDWDPLMVMAEQE